jgi:ligand-binding sensor domain-containing protein
VLRLVDNAPQLVNELERKAAARWIGAPLCVLFLGGCTKDARPLPVPSLRELPWASVEDRGPRSNDLRAVALDASGGVWFGTSSGASHYDATSDRWTGFSRADGLATNDVRAIAVDAAGGVWIGGLGGVSRQDPKTLAWKSYGEADGLISIGVQAVAVARDGVWVGTIGGVSHFDLKSGAFESYTAADGLADNEVRAIAIASNGDVWFGTMHGASRFDSKSGKFRSYRPVGGKSAAVRAIAVGSDERVWLGTAHGVTLLDPKSGKVATPPVPLASADVRAIVETGSGGVWFATAVGTSLLDKNAKLETFAAPAGIVDSDVRALAAEPGGKIWFATAGGAALFEPESQRWRAFSAEAGLADDDVTAIAVDSARNVWFGTSGGVSLFDNSTGAWQIWSHASGLVDNQVRVVAPGPAGAIWVGTRRGVSVIEPTSGLVSNLAGQERLAGRDVKSIAFDAAGATWLGTTAGAIRIRPHADPASAQPWLPVHLATDTSGRVWSANSGELRSLDPTSQTWSSFEDPHAVGVMPLPLLAFAISPTGQAWLGTSDGARTFDPTKSTWRSFERSDGLINEHVRAIAFEPAGAVWLGTPGGASRFDPQTNGWQTLTSADGLAADDVAAIAVEPTGVVWFGTSSGVTRFDPKSASTHTFQRAFRDSNDAHPLLASTGANTLIGRDGRLSMLSGSDWRALGPLPAGAPAIGVAPGPSDGAFWVGTELGGLTLRGGTQDEQLVSKAGLPDMTVCCVSTVPGGAGKLVWVGTAGGVALVEINATGLRVVRQAPHALPTRRAAAIEAGGSERAYVAFDAVAAKAGAPPLPTELWSIDGQRASLVSPAPDAQAHWSASQISGLSWSPASKRLWVGTRSGLCVADDHGLRRATANGVDLRLPISAIAVQNVGNEPGRELVWLGVDAGEVTAARLLRFDPPRGELISIAGVPSGKRFEALSLSPAGELVVMVDGKLARGQVPR